MHPFAAALVGRSRRRATTVTASLAMGLAGVAGAALAPATAHAHHYDYLLPAYGACGTGAEGDMSATYYDWHNGARCLVNEARARAGVPRLPTFSHLNDSSYRKATDISVCTPNAYDAYAVHRACGRPMDYWVKWPYSCASWGFAENFYIGSGASSTARAAVSAWLHSDGHRNNMLSSRWTGHGLMYSGPTNYPGIGSNTRIWVHHMGYCS